MSVEMGGQQHVRWGPETTPLDEATGVPLLIVPNDEALYLLDRPEENVARRESGKKIYADWNHAYHPNSAKELQSKGGRAIRECRGQMVMRREHDNYHASYSGPAPLPETGEERFAAAVFAAADYVPRQALDCSKRKPRTVDLSDEQIARLQKSGEVRMMRENLVGDFLQRYILKNEDFEHISPTMIDEFLKLKPDTADDLKRKQFLTHTLLSLVIEPSAAPLQTTYRKSMENRLWRPDGQDPVAIVHDEIVGDEDQSPRYFAAVHHIGELLSNKFAAFRDMAPAA